MAPAVFTAADLDLQALAAVWDRPSHTADFAEAPRVAVFAAKRPQRFYR